MHLFGGTNSGGTGGLTYVDRGALSVYDYSSASFTKDGNWHNLDVSAIVPSSAKLVVMRCRLNSTGAGKLMQIASDGYVGGVNSWIAGTQVTGINIYQTSSPIPMIGTGIIQYNITAATWSLCDLVILGWWL